MVRLFAGTTDFNALPTVQNETGINYRYINGTYWKPILKNFDAGIGKPLTVRRYTDGSHKDYLRERALDFSVNAGVKLSASETIKILGVLYSKSKKVCGFTFLKDNIHFKVYHCKLLVKVGTVVSAGIAFAQVMTAAENAVSGVGAVPPHIHIGTDIENATFSKTTVREVILSPVEPVLTCEQKLAIVEKELATTKVELETVKAENAKLQSKIAEAIKILEN